MTLEDRIVLYLGAHNKKYQCFELADRLEVDTKELRIALENLIRREEIKNSCPYGHRLYYGHQVKDIQKPVLTEPKNRLSGQYKPPAAFADIQAKIALFRSIPSKGGD